VTNLFELFMESDPACHRALGFVPTDAKVRARLVCDYVAGMTDRFAVSEYAKEFLPSGVPPSLDIQPPVPPDQGLL